MQSKDTYVQCFIIPKWFSFWACWCLEYTVSGRKKLPLNKYIILCLGFSYHFRIYKTLNICNFHGILSLIVFVKVYLIFYTEEVFSRSHGQEVKDSASSGFWFFQNVLSLVKSLEFCAWLQQERTSFWSLFCISSISLGC